MSNEKDELLSKQYQSESNEQVPSALDLQILDMAKAELEKLTESSSQKPLKKPKVWPQMYATAAVMIIGVGLVTFMQREAPTEISFQEPSPALLIENEINREMKEEKTASQQKFDNVEAPVVMEKKLLKQESEFAPRVKTNVLPSVSSAQQGAAMLSADQEPIAPEVSLQRELPMKQKSVAEEIEFKKRSEPEKNRFEFYSILPSQRADSMESEEIKSALIAHNTVDIKHVPIKTAKPGETIVHSFSITNEGIADEVYSIELLSNNPWFNKRDMPETVSISSKETYHLTIKSTIPTDVTKETIFEIKLSIKSRHNKMLSKEIVTKTSIIN